MSTVQTQSNDAFDALLIQLDHFNSQNKIIEINRRVQTIRFLRQLLSSETYAKYVNHEDSPGTNLRTEDN